MKEPEFEIFVPEILPREENTYGAHDPSAVRFGDTYYVYSTHNVIFTSKNLINWERHAYMRSYPTAPTEDYVALVSPKAYSFIKRNIKENVNRTYWAPDVVFVREDEETPYHMYLSVSCGIGTRDAAIALVKSSSPLFWADNDAVIEDCGVVLASVENERYKTNAIDANIYTDKNGVRYIIWGSFWGGVQGARLTKDGRVEGIDYSSDEAIMKSCENFGSTLFSQRDGIAGPEGPWLCEHGGYRYLFASCGWLGSNYSTRIGRCRSEISFDEVLKNGLFTDAEGTLLDGEHDTGSLKKPSGYKLIGSYRLGSTEVEMAKIRGSYAVIPKGCDIGSLAERLRPPKPDKNAKPIPPHQRFSELLPDGEPITYYGPGHNSVVEGPDGELFFVSHIRKYFPDTPSVLSVRRIIFTENGWPTVLPFAYEGERLQKLPVSLICGGYDLASVGVTVTAEETISPRSFDLPVLSCRIELLPDGKLADNKGVWSFDGSYTVRIEFTKDGDASKNEYYSSGDVLTMAAVLCYDRDSSGYYIALTGVDNKNITQFAAKRLG